MKNNSSFLAQFFDLILSSWISLIILLIIFLLSVVDQGQTVFIDLLDNRPVNLLLFYIISSGLSMVLSHFPTYIEQWSDSFKIKENDLKWDVNYDGFPKPLRTLLKSTYQHFGVGFITYKTSKKENAIKKFLRHSLGGFLYIAILYLLLTTLKSTLFFGLQNMFWLWGGIALFLFIHLLISCVYARESPPYKMILAISLVTLILKCITIIISIKYGWSQIIILLFIITLCFEIIQFSLYRKYRTKFNISILGFTSNDHTFYLFIIGFTGFVALMTVLYANCNLFRVNALVIILSYLHIIYGFIIIPLKHYLLYKYKSQKSIATKNKTDSAENGKIAKVNFLTKSLFPLAYLGIILIIILNFLVDNDLHLLKPIQLKSDPMTGKSYRKGIDKMLKDTKPIYFIASSGGGLKANIWNMLVLDSLDKAGILDRTIAMSGVSGGSLGQGLYAGLQHKIPERNRLNKIKEIGTKDFLSIDLAYFLGKDFFREFDFFSKTFSEDRAMVSMTNYSDEIDYQMLSHSFQDYWKKLYSIDHFPVIFSNSSSTRIQRGIASTIDFEDQFDSIFYDAIDILSFNDTLGIPYSYALSPSNRFPVFSPAAKIKGKGHFLDGGYFENSGMLTLKDYYFNQVQPHISSNKEVVFIQIFNDRSDYISKIIRDNDLKLTDNLKIKGASELLSILRTVTSISFLPRYERIKADLDKNITYVEIHLPYRIEEKDVLDYFKAKAFSPNNWFYEFEKSNNEINGYLEKSLGKSYKMKTIEPPLARILGPQAVDYMMTMKRRKDVWKELPPQ